MKVLVFGGTGFIGSYVVEELLRRGYTVKVSDISHKYFDEELFIKCDILDKNAVMEVVKSEPFDVVYNFAGYSVLDDAVNEPYKSLNLNIVGNLNIIEATRIAGIRNYIYASSAYAMSEKGSFYGISKLSSEKIVEEYQKRYGLIYRIIRYGSVYSERESENNFLYNLIKKAIMTNEIIHIGDGEEIREYINASDAARLSVDVLEKDEFINQHIILTGFEKMKRKELFEMIKEIMNNDLKITFKKGGHNHHYKTTPYQFQPSLSKKLLANPFIDMGQGILEIVKKLYAEIK